MNRFRKYKLVFYRGDKGARMTEKEGYIVRFVLTGRIIENIPNEVSCPDSQAFPWHNLLENYRQDHKLQNRQGRMRLDDV